MFFENMLILFHMVWNTVYFTIGTEGDFWLPCRTSFAEAGYKQILKNAYSDNHLVVLTWAEFLTLSMSEIKAVLDSFSSFSLEYF